MSIGGSFAQDVLVTAVDRKIAKKNARDELKRDSGDGKNFVPDVRFSIESLDYKTRLNMVSAGAAGNYLYMSKKLTAQAISDFFQGTK